MPTLFNIHVMSLKEESGRFFFHFREIFGKCIEHVYRKISDSFQGDFEFLLKKWYILEEFCQFYDSFPGVSLMMREVSHVWFNLNNPDRLT